MGGSISRFGDGELEIIQGGKIGFQKYDSILAKRLELVLRSHSNKCLTAIPDAISTLDNLTSNSKKYWLANMTKFRSIWCSYLDEERIYGNAHVSRCYIRYDDKSNCTRWFNRIKKLFNGRDLVIIEGTQTKMGVGNDLLSGAASIRRILCPAENAFVKYDEVYTYVLENIEQTALVLLALGPTASILAYDLANANYQALDIGHVDIEYEWYLKKAVEKEMVKGKYTNEVLNGNDVEDSLWETETAYFQQVLTRIE